MRTRARSYLMSGLVIISLISSSSLAAETKSTSNVRDTLDQKTSVNSLQLRNAIRLSIYESCFTKQFLLPLDGLSAKDLHMLLMLCLGNGLSAAKKQFGFDMQMIEE